MQNVFKPMFIYKTVAHFPEQSHSSLPDGHDRQATRTKTNLKEVSVSKYIHVTARRGHECSSNKI